MAFIIPMMMMPGMPLGSRASTGGPGGPDDDDPFKIILIALGVVLGVALLVCGGAALAALVLG